MKINVTYRNKSAKCEGYYDGAWTLINLSTKEIFIKSSMKIKTRDYNIKQESNPTNIIPN